MFKRPEAFGLCGPSGISASTSFSEAEREDFWDHGMGHSFAVGKSMLTPLYEDSGVELECNVGV